ncbi:MULTISPECIES: hypothetical protein [Rhodococcus]|uniref:EfeO-type cupredoxin-like domain-containing protein n=1 Tax=Rhodococcus jostii (strain RHA1) TaxID=101510 RepID=Q0SE21_RHOJR|nr:MULTISPECIES: hypothetical protein [Rhodococcus]ABG94215.1 conserved hypothetical protein [Rhodococcus jostii RHA1]
MIRRLAGVVVVPAVVVALVSGCGGDNDTPATDDGVVIDVVIDAGSVTPSNERIEAAVGETVTVRIESDADDELHVHAVPEHSFEIHPGTQETQFSVDVPGQVAVELHDTGKTVATLLVRP